MESIINEWLHGSDIILHIHIHMEHLQVEIRPSKGSVYLSQSLTGCSSRTFTKLDLNIMKVLGIEQTLYSIVIVIKTIVTRISS